MKNQICFVLNGEVQELDIDPATPLIYALRNDLRVVSPRHGCGDEQCGACRVIVDDQAEYSCTFTIGEAEGKEVRTLESLLDGESMHPLQQAILDINAGQCGYCLSGIIASAIILLDENPRAGRAEIQAALAGHLCRCGAHNRIIHAVEQAAETVAHG